MLWRNIYNLISIVIIPSMICSIVNILIYNHVRTSTNRIYARNNLKNIQQKRLHHRDLYLLRHMIFMFCIFVGGWTPIFLLPIIDYYTPVSGIINGCLVIWCELALLINVIDLFLYNHEVRRYINGFCLKCCIKFKC